MYNLFSRNRKRTSVVLLVIFVNNITMPSVTYALTGGPSQPEVENFEPISTNQMVDAFTGDFTYNIPLLTVPGPNGGYPINMAYHSGIAMEQEASWVGLGWTLNVGAITRGLRGIPDDFSGIEKINRKQNMKAQNAFGLTIPFEIPGAPSSELFGLEFDQMKAMVSKDSYRGMGLKFVRNRDELTKKGYTKFEEGCISGLTPEELTKQIQWEKTLGDFIQTGKLPSGVKRVGKPNERKIMEAEDRFVPFKAYIPTSRDGLSMIYAKFSQSSSLPTSSASRSMISGNFEYTGWNASINAVPVQGIIPIHWERTQNLSGNFSSSWLNDEGKNQDIPAVGLHYAENANKESYEDFSNVAQVGVVTKRTPFLPIPVQNQDVFNVNGQGLNGAFRGFRKDFGVFNPPSIWSNSTSGGGGVEVAQLTTPTSTDYDFGVNLNLSIAGTYDGEWIDNNGLSNVDFKQGHVGLSENHYYQMTVS